MKLKAALPCLKSWPRFWRRTTKGDAITGPPPLDIDCGHGSPTKSDLITAAPTNSANMTPVDDLRHKHEDAVHCDATTNTVTTSGPKSLWDQAYDGLQADKPHVVKNYEELLNKVLLLRNRKPHTVDLESLLSDSTTKTETREHASQSSFNRKKTMEDIIALGQKHVDEKKITFKIGEQEFALQDQIQTAIACVQVGKVWVDEAVQASPLATAAWAGVCLLLPLLTNPPQVQATNEQGLAYVTMKIRYYTNMESRVLREQHDALSPDERKLFEERFVKLYQAIIDFQAQTTLRFFRDRFKNLLRDAVKCDPWEEMLKRVKSLGNNLEKESLVFNSSSSSASLNALANWAKDTEEDKCRQCFSSRDYAWYKNRVEERVPDTCLWFLNHPSYHSWLEADSNPLLVTADPGCGKSVLVKYLVDSKFGFRVPKETAVCYFFFKEGDQNKITQALCALLHQLLCLRPQLMFHAKEKYKQHGGNLSGNSTELWNILKAAAADKSAGPVILVLDALDECRQDEQNMKTLVRMIREYFNGSPRNFKILMTSRPYRGTIQPIQELEKLYINIRIRGEDETKIIRKEVNAVIEHRVTQLGGLDSDLRMRVRDHLLSIPRQHTFLWVHLVFEYLEDTRIKMTAKGLEEALHNLSFTVEDAYDKMLRRSTDPETTKKALSILLAAYRPLTLTEMQVALDMNLNITSEDMLDLEPDDAFYRRLRELCGLFITQHNGKLYFLHQTAREFLLPASVSSPSSTSTLVWAHQFSLRQAHTVLVEACVQYLAFPNLSGFEEWLDPSDNIVKESKFLEYSADYWPSHFREADPDGGVIVSLALKASEPRRVSAAWPLPRPDLPFEMDWINGPSILRAAAWGHTAVVQSLLTTDALREDHIAYALATAVSIGNGTIVKLLLGINGTDVNFKLPNSDTALIVAAINGHEGVVKILLSAHGIDVNYRPKRGDTAILHAIRKGHEGVVKLLLATNRVHINKKQGNNDGTPLTLAAMEGHKSIVKLLLATVGIDVNKQGIYSLTPLQVAVGYGHESVVQLLLATNGINVNARRFGGETALMRAANSPTSILEHCKVIFGLLLAASGIDVNLKNDEGDTALTLAIKNRCGRQAVKLLLAKDGVDLNTQRTSDGWTPLHIAICTEDGEAMVKLLLEAGKVDLDLKTKEGFSPLSLARQRGKKSIVELLEDERSRRQNVI
ncbi:hypothetical protein F5Y03DRAFT_378339 [Xylaria venustula]|nr:hypothetical protein F5Y03DRAFT_378339 [Xylaria venustula]